jgi:hypothetical protein
MDNITLFKEIASKKLSVPLFEELEPHLELFFEYIEIAHLFEHEYREERYSRLQEIKKDFDNQVKSNWPAFARERWPEIETYFELEDKTQVDFRIYADDVPF